MSSSIERELVKCKQSAEEGYELANAKYAEIKDTLIEAARNLSKTDMEQSQVSRIRNTELVEKQKDELRRLTDEIKPIGDDLQNLRGRMKDFSIVVYGRTMAGKSTLMEILTHGNGKSIGKGSQRTTLDVRDYYWNGLKITDVPGICAFEGAEDERLALEAAKAADLILFLLTSDAPQPDEAACLAQLKSFGKSVLGIINVKMNFNIRDDLDIEDLQDKMADTSNINATIDQFKQFAANHNQDWSGIKFVATHLLSAYQSQDKNQKVFKISRFAEVEDFILDKVRSDGRFLRIKTFVDSVSVPMSNIILKIYEQSAKSLLESDVWFDKRRQLSEWSKKFVERSQEKLNTLYNQLSDELDRAISDFSYYHCEDKNAGANWQSRFQSLKFDKKYQDFLKDLANECERKRKELSDELTQELSYTVNNNARVSIHLDDTTPVGQYLSFAISAAGFLFAPLFLAGFLGNLFFDSKEKQRQQNREKLRDAITPKSYEVLGKMHDKVIDTFNDKILAEGVDGLYDLLAGYQFMLARLGESQYNVAAALSNNFRDLNYKLLEEAVAYTNAGTADVGDIPRIPGEKTIIFAKRSNLDTQTLSNLLGENVSVMKPEEDFADTVKKVLGSDFDVDNYWLDFDTDEKKAERAVAVFPKNKVDATNFKLAQQIASVPIIAEFIQSQRISTLPNVNSHPQSTRRNNQSNTTSSGGRQQIDVFESDFKRIDSMFANCASNYAIRNALDLLRVRAGNLRDAAAMNKIADYYQKISEYQKAFSCRDEAKTFSTGRSNQPPKTSSDGRTQSNAFKSDFAKIDEMFERPRKSNEGIKKALQKLESKVSNQRDAIAITRVAAYYGRIHEYQDADRCYELAKKFSR